MASSPRTRRSLPRRRPVAKHDDRMSVVDHLGELRARLFVSIAAFAVAFGFAAWQSKRVLEIVTDPLPDNIPEPTTFGVTEAFTTTLTNSAYAAILLALPVILYEMYAFVLPAFSPEERRIATPMLLLVPFLFIGGVVFCYFVVLPPALDFLLSFNSDVYNTQVRARDYYSFVTLTMAAMGIGFQLPVGIVIAVRAGLTTPQKLRKNRRYAFLACAVVAALLPTIDPVTMLLETLPLYLLYELSILLSSLVGKPKPVEDE
jgi:sec-independent protein translocase protein TatC